MILIAQDKTLLMFVRDLVSINIHRDGDKIMACATHDRIRDRKIAEYTTKEKCKRAFGALIDAIVADVDIYQMLEDSDPQLNTVTQGSTSFRRTRTNGKTK